MSKTVAVESNRTIIDVLSEHNHICWYPNAGYDFREVVFLSDWYYEKYGIMLTEEESLPDLFLITDGSPDTYVPIANGVDKDTSSPTGVELLIQGGWKDIRYLFNSEKTTHRFQKRTEIIVSRIEKLSGHIGAFYMELSVISRYEGQVHEYQVNMLYVLENSINFFRDTVLRNRIALEYIINCADWSKDLDGDRKLSIYWLRSYLKYCSVKHYLEPASKYLKDEIEQMSDADNIIIAPYLAEVLGEMDGEYADVSKLVPYYDLSSRYPKPLPHWNGGNMVWSRVRYRNNSFRHPLVGSKRFHWIGINTDNVYKTYDYHFTYIYKKHERHIYMNKGEACLVYNKYFADSLSESEIIEKEIKSVDFEDAMRKLYIAHVLTYGCGILVTSYRFGRYANEYKVTAHSQGARLFPFIESMIGSATVDLPIAKYENVLDSILNSNRSEDLTKREIVSLFAFLKSENRDFVIDRFSDLWTSMNAFYGELVIRYNNQIEQVFGSKKVFAGITELTKKEILEMVKLSSENDTQGQKVLEKYICGKGARARYSLQTDIYKRIRNDRSSNFKRNYIENVWPELDSNQIPYKENKTWVFKQKVYKDIFRDMAENVPTNYQGTRAVSFYDFYKQMETDLLDENYHNQLMSQNNAGNQYTYPELVKRIEGEYGEYLYFYVLIDLAYHYRCVYFHGSQTGVMVEDRDGYENRRLTMLCDCLERFLADHIHELFENFMFEGRTLKSICNYAISSNRNIRGKQSQNGQKDAQQIIKKYLDNHQDIWES